MESILKIDNDEEEFDEPLSSAPESMDDGKSDEIIGEVDKTDMSAEYIESLDAIASDCWDISSWMVFLEEVEQNRAGKGITVSQAYSRILAQFPCSANLWKRVIERNITNEDWQSARDSFSCCLIPCRSVDLWKLYLSMLRQMPVDNQSASKIETAFEEALSSVGYCLDAVVIWQEYINYVREVPVFDSIIEVGKKLAKLRQLYQRAVVVPMDQSEALWADYEVFEKVNSVGGNSNIGGESTEAVLADLGKRHLHAKSILRERKRLSAHIQFGRFASPPTHSSAEMQQLALWNTWTRFELSNPDNLEPEQLYSYMRLLYDQCLCCFRFNPEVWLCLMNFVQQHKGHDEARSVCLLAIECNPSVSLLRVALAELEEVAGSNEAAEAVLRETFQTVPCGFTFALYQRFVRRTSGKLAARKLFSGTMGLRSSDPQLGFEICMAHARLEDDVNCDSSTALKVLALVKDKYHAQCCKDTSYVRAVSKLLLKLGDLQQLRWVFQQALSEVASSDKSVVKASGAKASGLGGSSSAVENARLELELLDEFLRCETQLNVSDTAALNELRSKRHRAKLAFEELDRARMGASASWRDRDESRAGGATTMFQSAVDLTERYEQIGLRLVGVPALDRDLRERSRGMMTSYRQPNQQSGNTSGQVQRRGESEVLNMSAEFHLSLTGLPVMLRDLLAKLPLHNGPAPDIDGFIRHIRGITLPPRPAVEESDAALDAPRDEKLPSWLDSSCADADNEDGDGSGLAGRGAERDGTEEAPDEDLFRKRQRVKLVE